MEKGVDIAMEPFLGYCFNKDGYYPEPVHLTGIQAAVQYFNLQRGLQYCVRIIDSSDAIVLESKDGVIVFPTLEQININR